MPTTIEVWIQLENHAWDLSPHDKDRMTGQRIRDKDAAKQPVSRTLTSPVTGHKQTRTMFQPMTEDALIFRRYTADWAAPDDRKVNPWDINEPDPTDTGTMGTIPGATVELELGDDVIIHFRNMDQRTVPGTGFPPFTLQIPFDGTINFPGIPPTPLPVLERTHSIHPHGVVFDAQSDGAYPLSPPSDRPENVITAAEAPLWASVGVTGQKKMGDRVPPGGTFTYHWQTFGWPTTAGVWLYHDHSVCDDTNVSLGAIGLIVVHNTNDPDDFTQQDLPGGAINGSPIETICFPIPRTHFLPHALQGIADLAQARMDGIDMSGAAAMDMADAQDGGTAVEVVGHEMTGMKGKRQPAKRRSRKNAETATHFQPSPDRMVNLGDVAAVHLDEELARIIGICFSHYVTPPTKALYLQLYHELKGMGMCINGRQYLGNTPTVVAGRETLMRFGVVGMNMESFHTFHIHGHRWIIPGPDGVGRNQIQGSVQDRAVSQFEDTRIFGPANSFVFTIKEGDSFMRAEPPIGEWHMHCHVLAHMMGGMMGSLLVVDEGMAALPLPSGKPCPADAPGGMGGMNGGGGQQQPATVNVQFPNFTPNPQSVKVGQTVNWVNHDSFAHTATSDTAGQFDVSIAANATGSHTFTAVGTFPYHCSIHPNMTATIVVTN